MPCLCPAGLPDLAAPSWSSAYGKQRALPNDLIDQRGETGKHKDCGDEMGTGSFRQEQSSCSTILNDNGGGFSKVRRESLRRRSA